MLLMFIQSPRQPARKQLRAKAGVCGDSVGHVVWYEESPSICHLVLPVTSHCV